MEIVGQQRIKIGLSWYNVLCPKCGSDDKRLKTPYCKKCSRDYGSNHRDYSSEYRSKKQLIEFVDRINRRRGMASMQEVYVEMVTLFHYFYQSRGILDQFNPTVQLEVMWRYLNDLVNNYKNSIIDKPKLSIDIPMSRSAIFYHKNKSDKK